MADSVTPAVRSQMMSRVRHKDTKPELVIRRMLHKAGFRYRLHVAGLPGKPDLVFPKRKKVIFVHGCFWHLHEDCQRAGLPKSRTEFWTKKLHSNRARDLKNLELLEKSGWSAFIVWECQLNAPTLLEDMINFLNENVDVT